MNETKCKTIVITGVSRGLDNQRGSLEETFDHRAGGSGQRRHDRTYDNAGDLRLVEAAVLEQAFDEQAQFVRRPLAKSLKPPALDQRVPVERTDHHVGVADVNG